MAFSKGVRTDQNKKQSRVWASDIHNGDWIKLREVDFSKGATAIEACAASALQGGTMEVRLDKEDGTVIATVAVAPTGGWEEWQTFTAPVTASVSGKHDIYLVFKGLKGSRLFNLDWWRVK